jgi:SAM-dependent methyltransferase
MPLNLSRRTDAPPIEEFYTSIHRRMVQSESATNDIRPTALEFSSALKQFSINPAGVALDAGCGGTGSMSLACAEQGFQRIAAIDINHRSLCRAREVGKGTPSSGIWWCEASVASIPFPDDTFDFVVCSGVVHHTPNPEQSIQELTRVIKKGGVFYISLYCFQGASFEKIVRLIRWIGGIVPFSWVHRLCSWNRVMNNFVLDHMYVAILWVFRAEEVRNILARNGFSIIAEWPSEMDPFRHSGKVGDWLSGGGLMRVWLCEKR